MKHFISKVITLEEIAYDFFDLVFTWNSDEIPEPGQFITIRTSNSSTPLLRRPFAISSFNPERNTASIIFQRIGQGTQIMSSLKKDDILDILGPLGNSFLKNDFINNQSFQNHIIVAGGIGIGPMLYLTESLANTEKKPLLIVGSRTASSIPLETLSQKVDPVICTDDGSYGFKGNVVDYMKTLANITGNTTIYCCGPEPMLKSCHLFAKGVQAKCIVSLEQIMACGIGACMGCTCETVSKKKYARVCKDGPVFNSCEVKWTYQ